MIAFTYLEKGVNGLSRAHLASALAGHLGAALIAGYCFGEEQPDLPEPVYRGIEAEMDRVLRGEEAIWFNAKKAGITVAELFAPMPDSPPQPRDVARIAEALAGNIGELHQSGHNVIFASLAIRALTDHEQFATAERIDGIVKLIRAFKGQKPGMAYLGKERGLVNGLRIVPLPNTNFPAYEDLTVMAKTTIHELITAGHIRRQGFGGMWHLINHAAGLIDLAEYGYRKLARQGMAAHHRHLRLWRSLPDVSDELGKLPKAPFDPRTAEFWQQDPLKRDDARLTHRIKTLYGCSRLLSVIDDEETHKQAWDRLRYMMA